jgi:hypothetical protein
MRQASASVSISEATHSWFRLPAIPFTTRRRQREYFFYVGMFWVYADDNWYTSAV